MKNILDVGMDNPMTCGKVSEADSGWNPNRPLNTVTVEAVTMSDSNLHSFSHSVKSEIQSAADLDSCVDSFSPSMKLAHPKANSNIRDENHIATPNSLGTDASHFENIENGNSAGDSRNAYAVAELAQTAADKSPSPGCKSDSFSRQIVRSCRRCSKPFAPSPSALRKGLGFFCSPSCRSKERRPGPGNFRTPESTKAERVRANGLINKRLRDGKITRPTACMECRQSRRLMAHHPDYSRPAFIVWLCRPCHLKSHHSAEFGKRVAAKAFVAGGEVVARCSHIASPSPAPIGVTR